MVRNFIRLFLLSSALGASVGLASAQTSLMDWNLAFSQPGLARASMSMVYDSGAGVMVMFGGRNASTLVPSLGHVSVCRQPVGPGDDAAFSARSLLGGYGLRFPSAQKRFCSAARIAQTA